MNHTIVTTMFLILGLIIGLGLSIPSAPADANPQYCCCETSCHALGTCETHFDWEKIDECASDVYCSRGCTEASMDTCGD